jgi:predicted nuclease of predicted toxin-antitoxin system
VSGDWPPYPREALFDQNLSPWLCRRLADRFPGSNYVREIGLRDAEDVVIWVYAARHGFAIVTKDADFRQRSFLPGHPPRIIWLRPGNGSTKAIEALLRSRVADIEQFLADQQRSFLSLSD